MPKKIKNDCDELLRNDSHLFSFMVINTVGSFMTDPKMSSHRFYPTTG